MSTAEWIITSVLVLIGAPAIPEVMDEWLDWGFENPFLFLFSIPLAVLAIIVWGAFKWVLIFRGEQP